jgi:antitoxin component of RelBE/YafQ-DinJ toxin-antitoxin module
MAADQIVRARIDLDTKERATAALEAMGFQYPAQFGC